MAVGRSSWPIPASLLLLFGALFAGCGNDQLVTPTFVSPTPLTETTINTDGALATFRVERLEEFGATQFRFNGSILNTSGPLANARFEVLSRKNIPDPNGFQEEKVIATQNYGQLVQGQVVPIAVTGVVPNVASVSVTGRFNHD